LRSLQGFFKKKTQNVVVCNSLSTLFDPKAAACSASHIFGQSEMAKEIEINEKTSKTVRAKSDGAAFAPTQQTLD
jgi:hypothetical protein